ncbi:MAG: DUF4831 family protein, partial [Rikenellaceae bacterium]|nr:DUF4831 family protein [Rikenellaceae bacterium]
MKKSVLPVLLAAFAVATAHGQSTKSVPLASGGTVAAHAVTYSLPQTVISVTFTVERETIKKGPYARYAQKYLGAVAHLSDKEIYTITGASLSYSSEADPSAVYALDHPDKTPFDLYIQTPEGNLAQDGPMTPRFGPRTLPGREHAPRVQDFEGVQVDKLNANDPSLEEAAAQAARTLFTLRQRRFDLVTGEAGEYVYGAGLEAALQEMQRLE